MAFGTHHVHVKTRDPKKTMQFYVDNLGATLLADQGARGYRVSLHGLQLNITPLIDMQKREQHYGIEHIAVDTDDRLRAHATFSGALRTTIFSAIRITRKNEIPSPAAMTFVAHNPVGCVV